MAFRIVSPRWLKRNCLKSSDSLRRQLLKSFGVSALITLLLVVFLSCVAIQHAGSVVQQQVDMLLEQQRQASVWQSARHSALYWQQTIDNLEDVVLIMTEVTRDRIVGFSPLSNKSSEWRDDVHVPFYDELSKRNVYPLVADLVPLRHQSWTNNSTDGRQEWVEGTLSSSSTYVVPFRNQTSSERLRDQSALHQKA